MSPNFFTREQKLVLTSTILSRGKMIAADRFPKPNPDTVEAWADSFDTAFRRYPFPEMWTQAIALWGAETVSERMCTPRDIISCVKAVAGKWERDTALSQRLQSHRDAVYELNTGLPAANRTLGA